MDKMLYNKTFTEDYCTNRKTALNSHLQVAPDHFTENRLYYASSFNSVGSVKKPKYLGTVHQCIYLLGLSLLDLNSHLEVVTMHEVVHTMQYWGETGVQQSC